MRKPSDEFTVAAIQEAMVGELISSGRLPPEGGKSTCREVNGDCQSLSAHGEHVQPDMYWDTVSGKTLPPDLVKRAREEDMKHIRNMDVYCKVPTEQCINATGKHPIGNRWVDINKSDDENPQYRYRLVAK